MTYHVTCNTDDNYAQHCCAMLCSLFENNKDMGFNVHILTSGLSVNNMGQIKKLCEKYQSQLMVYDVDESRLEGVKFRKSRPLTKAAYYRILLPDYLDKSIERVLYLDCDMIVMGSLKELFDLEIDNYALAATLDCMPWNSIHRSQLQFEADERSFCSGIMMINLKYWREHDAMEKLLEYSKRDKNPVHLHDQDSFNYVFKKQWFLIPPKWNKPSNSFLTNMDNLQYFDIFEYVYNPKIIHFSSQAKPWLNMTFPYSSEYRFYLDLSGFDNPHFTKVTFRERLLFSIWNAKYYIRKYIVPFVPRLFIFVIEDIAKFFKIIIVLINRRQMKEFMLKESLKAIKL